MSTICHHERIDSTAPVIMESKLCITTLTCEQYIEVWNTCMTMIGSFVFNQTQGYTGPLWNNLIHECVLIFKLLTLFIKFLSVTNNHIFVCMCKAKFRHLCKQKNKMTIKSAIEDKSI